MEDFYDELSLLLQETTPMDASYSMEPSFSFAAPEPLPSLVPEASMINPMETTIPVTPVEPNVYVDQPNPPPPSSRLSVTFNPTNDQFAFMPTPNPTLDNPVPSFDQLGFGSIAPFDNGSFAMMTGDNLYHLQPQVEYYQAFNPNPNPNSNFDHMSLIGHFDGQNWEAIASYLAGQVRPGPDVPRVYKCSICFVEFPNAQAFGGHMSSHSKIKRRERPKGSRSSKGCQVAKKGKVASSLKVAKGTKNKKKVEKKMGDESENREFII